MSLLIKGMEMPKSCDICPFMTTNDDLSVEDYRYMYCGFPGIGEFVTDYEATRHPDCPLIEVPTPHGPLKDADALLKEIPETSTDLFENCRYCRLLDDEQVKMIINNAPTIIEAEEGETHD